jgi:hypothetical protein
VSFVKDGKHYNKKIHLLVLRAFKGEAPGMVARHLDGNPMNNRLDNLCWGTYKENSSDMIKHGRSQRGEKNVNTDLNAKKVRLFRMMYRDFGWTQVKIARIFNVNRNTVHAIIAKRSWKYA